MLSFPIFQRLKVLGRGYFWPKSNDYKTGVYARTPDTARTSQIYQVRVVSIDSSIVGRVSPTSLTIRPSNKPPKPIVDSLYQQCIRIRANGYLTQLGFTALPNAKVRIYRDARESNPRPDGIFKGLDFPTDYFDIYYYSYNNRGYVEFWNNIYRYPCENYETKFYFTQTVDGCESDKARTIYQELCREEAFKFDEFVYGDGYTSSGRVTYCQGDLALPLNQKGYKPDNNQDMYLLFGLPGTSRVTSTTVIPTPNTDKPGFFTYTLQSVPYDPTKLCPLYHSPSSLNVIVDPRPTLPIGPLLSPTYYQNQPAVALTAATNSTATTLRWYRPDATGVPSLTSATAPVPPTDKPGSFTYLGAFVNLVALRFFNLDISTVFQNEREWQF